MFSLLASGAALFLWAGCSAKHYRQSADKDAYAIIRKAEGALFHRTNAFSIDTPYSGRDVNDIRPPELIEDRTRTNRRTLSIEQALELATHSRRYQTEKERLYLKALSLTGAKHPFTPRFTGTSDAGVERSTTGDVSASLRNSVGLNQFFRSGGDLGLSLANTILRYYTGDGGKSVISLASVNLTQPLLRGFGKNDPTVEALTQAQRDVVYAMRSFSYFQNSFALEIANDYFALLTEKDTIRNSYTNYLSRVQSTQRLEARKDREKQSDVDQARQSELSAKNNYINAQAAYKNLVDAFKIKLGLTLGEEIALDDSVLEEIKKTGLVAARLDPLQGYRLATEKQLLILNSIDAFEDTQRKVGLVKDRLRPGLTLTGQARLQSEGPTDYTKFDLDNIYAFGGLELDWPFDRLQQRNAYRTALVEFESRLRDLTLTLDQLRNDIDRGLRTLEQRRKNFENQKVQLEVATRRVDSLTLEMQAGRTELLYLLDAQDALLRSQNALLLALIDYQQTRLQLMLDIGALQTDKPRFWLLDHLAGFLPEPDRKGPAPDETEPPVIPPDEFFKQ